MHWKYYVLAFAQSIWIAAAGVVLGLALVYLETRLQPTHTDGTQYQYDFDEMAVFRNEYIAHYYCNQRYAEVTLPTERHRSYACPIFKRVAVDTDLPPEP